MTKRGFTLIEVLIAIAILAVVGMSVAHFIGTSKKISQRISTSSGCDQMAQSFVDLLGQYGLKINPSEPIVSSSQNVDGDALTGMFNAVPVIERVDATRIRINSSQLSRSTAAAMMAIYNTKGVEVCNGNGGLGLDVSGMDWGNIAGSGSRVYLKIEPHVASTNQSLNCPPPPLRYGSLSKNVDYSTNPPHDKTETKILLPDGDRQFQVTVTFEFEENQVTKTCQATSTFGFAFDDRNITNLSGATVTSGNPATMKTINYDTNGDSTPDQEWVSCGTSAGSQAFRDITVRVPFSTSGIEMGSAIVCRGRVLDDAYAGVTGDVGEWNFCDQFTFPSPATASVNSVVVDTANSEIRFTFRGLAPDLTYQVEMGSADSGSNFLSSFVTFSIDGTRPTVTNIQETTGRLVPPKTPIGGVNVTWPPNIVQSKVQCDAANTTFRGTINGRLIARTISSCVGNGFSGPLNLTNPQYSCQGNHAAAPGFNDIQMTAVDVCGQGAPTNFEWPVITQVPEIQNLEIKTTSPQGISFNHLPHFPRYDEVAKDYCPLSSNFTTQGYCTAGNSPDFERAVVRVMDACGGTDESSGSQTYYCPTDSRWSIQRCKNGANGLTPPTPTQVCRE
ncbi:MAG: prepilin-type N-terminal cleavage/methylation domain-containing protein, partial [Bdellovibrionales bacterium]|nr:prepilin-type N-terminal cleavage/methylation domain-containing protein [Bdellovibrionales bacterium]